MCARTIVGVGRGLDWLYERLRFEEGGSFSSLILGVAFNTSASGRPLPSACLGLGRTLGRSGLFGGLGLGMYDVLRLSVRNSGGCCNVRCGRRFAKRGWSRFGPLEDCLRFLLGLSGLLEAIVYVQGRFCVIVWHVLGVAMHLRQ